MADFDPDAYLSQKNQDNGFDPDTYLSQKQPQPPGFWEQAGRNAVNQLPLTGALVGGLAGTPLDAITGPMGTVTGAGIGGYLGTAAKNAINSYISPQEAPQTMGQVIGQPILGGAQAAANEITGQAISPYVSGFLKNYARSKTMQATGATGKEAYKMLQNNTDLPEQLLQKKIVNFGSSPENVAVNAQNAIDDAEEIKQTIVNRLPNVTVNRNTVLNQIKGSAAALSGNEAEKGLISKLGTAANDVQEQISNKAENVTAQLRNKIPNVSNLKLNYGEPQLQTVNTQTSQPFSSPAGPYQNPVYLPEPTGNFNPYDPDFKVPVSSIEQSGLIEHPEIPLQQSETVRKSWDNNAKWNAPGDSETKTAAKIVANAYRGAAEDAIAQADPQLGSAYKAAKTTQHILYPVQEAAEKRASTLNQSPMGGFGDVVTGGAAAAVGGNMAVVPTIAAKKMLFPRLPSMLGTTSNALGNNAGAIPGAIQIANPPYGLMAPPPPVRPLPPNYSTIPGRNGQ